MFWVVMLRVCGWWVGYGFGGLTWSAWRDLCGFGGFRVSFGFVWVWWVSGLIVDVVWLRCFGPVPVVGVIRISCGFEFIVGLV